MDHLLDLGLTCITVLDVSGGALARARRRLAERAGLVTWIEADVTGQWTPPAVDVWHDRAVLHFLTKVEQREAYVRHVHAAIKMGGSAIIGTFALDGPAKCSGLPVERYSATTIAMLLGSAFELADAIGELHRTPAGGQQAFSFARLVRVRT